MLKRTKLPNMPFAPLSSCLLPGTKTLEKLEPTSRRKTPYVHSRGSRRVFRLPRQPHLPVLKPHVLQHAFPKQLGHATSQAGHPQYNNLLLSKTPHHSSIPRPISTMPGCVYNHSHSPWPTIGPLTICEGERTCGYCKGPEATIEYGEWFHLLTTLSMLRLM